MLKRLERKNLYYFRRLKSKQAWFTEIYKISGKDTLIDENDIYEFVVYQNISINYNMNYILLRIEFDIKANLQYPQKYEITHVKLYFGNDNGILELKRIDF